MTFLLIELNKPAKFQWKLVAYLDTTNQTIVTDCYQQIKKKNLQQNSKAPEQLY